MTMPEDSAERLREAVRLERGGLLDRALDRLIEAEASEDPALRAEALRHRADIHRARCEWEEAFRHARLSREVAESAGLGELAAEASNAEAAVHMSRQEYPRAAALLAGMLERATRPRIRGIALQNLGVIASEQGRLGDARERFEESRGCFEAAGYQRGVALAMVNAARVLLLEDDDETAESLCAQAEMVAQRVGDLEIAAMAAFNRAEALIRGGRHQEAEEPASVALGYFAGVGNDWRRMDCLRLFGDLHAALGELATARHCYERALELARANDTPREVARLEQILARLAPVQA